MRAYLIARERAGLGSVDKPLVNEEPPDPVSLNLDPTIVLDVFIVALDIIQKGFSKYPDYEQKMLTELTHEFRPYFKLAYNQVREFMEAQGLQWGMSSREEVARYEKETDQTLKRQKAK